MNALDLRNLETLAATDAKLAQGDRAFIQRLVNGGLAVEMTETTIAEVGRIRASVAQHYKRPPTLNVS